jgi:uncharacterized protein with GYD domain
MPRYLVQGKYTQEGLKGLMQDGGSGRKAAVQKAVKSLGGKLEGFYFALGDADVYVIAELPDAVAAATISMAAAASGAVTLSTRELLTPADMDAAIEKSVSYRSPGSKA